MVEHGPHAVVQAWELASLAVAAPRLDAVRPARSQTGVEMAWRFRRRKGEVRSCASGVWTEGPPESAPRPAGLYAGDGKPVAMNLVVEDACRLAITLEGVEAAPRTMTVPPLTPAELIGRQLSDRERDPVFRESMAVAQVMARSVANR